MEREVAYRKAEMRLKIERDAISDYDGFVFEGHSYVILIDPARTVSIEEGRIPEETFERIYRTYRR